jgi:hypothetical protein
VQLLVGVAYLSHPFCVVVGVGVVVVVGVCICCYWELL